MKSKYGFISNSSSTSFIIRNKSNETKTLVDFVIENPQLIENYLDEYDLRGLEESSQKYTFGNLVKSAEENNITFEPNSSRECIFGDEQDTIIGDVFDYILRDGGSSESFEWKFNEYLR